MSVADDPNVFTEVSVRWVVCVGCVCRNSLGFLVLGREGSFGLGKARLLVKAVIGRDAWISEHCQQQFHVFLARVTLY